MTMHRQRLREGLLTMQYRFVSPVCIAMCACIGFSLLTPAPLRASTTNPLENPKALLDLPLEHLSNMMVTSVSKREQQYKDAAAAIFVLTEEDIRRSGATTLPEALRHVPGLQVARAHNHGWVVTARGSASQFANKLLVLMDGRMIYTPLFAGVYWDMHMPLMENIARIEVIRGPGATLWGANAVNGVINIITKRADETLGHLVQTRTGSEERGAIAYRYGEKLDENTALRATGTMAHRRQGDAFEDESRLRNLSLRLDHALPEDANLTVQSQLFSGEGEYDLQLPSLTAPFQSFADDTESYSGGYVMATLDKPFSLGQLKLQSYWDHHSRERATLNQQQDILNLDAEFNADPIGAHQWVMGMGARLMMDSLEGTPYMRFTPEERTDYLWSAFLQDDIRLSPNRWYLTLGTKLEINDYSGFEWQPSVRLRWHATENQTFWAAASRAIRSPARAVDDISYIIPQVSTTPLAYRQLVGSRHVSSENMHALEFGWRYVPRDDLSFDSTLFYQDYQDIFSATATGIAPSADPFFAPANVITLRPGNQAHALSTGLELAADWQALPEWRLRGSYSFLNHKQSANAAVGSDNLSPSHQWQLESRWDVAEDWQFDQWLAYVDDLEDTTVDAYLRLDLRLAWQAMDGLELSLVGQNLLEETHQEFPGFLYTTPTNISRAVYGQVTWRF